MKFDLFCSLHKDSRGNITAENDYCALFNVLLTDDNISFDERVHSFVLVVNKKGSLTLLCIK